MIPREVTIGRAPDNDIQYGQQCMLVSNHHALIYSNNNSLIFQDMSTNGTWINGTKVHKQSVVIHYGDNILIAGKYQLPWNKLGMYFPLNDLQSYPVTPSGTVINQKPSANQGYTPAAPANQGYSPAAPSNPAPANPDPVGYAGNNPIGGAAQQPQSGTYNVDVEITRFNWGAFFLYPYWGFANGMWWLFFLYLLVLWAIPLVPNIVFGIMGSKWAWKAKQWRDINHFVDVQTSWKKWGIGLFLVGIGLGLIWIICLVAFASALF